MLDGLSIPLPFFSVVFPPRHAHDALLPCMQSPQEIPPPQPHSDYLDRLMRRQSFQALWPLFAKAQQPAKEMTESFAALVHLRPFLAELGPCRVIHVGDGAHARSAALFALKTTSESISVDPLINLKLVGDWQEQFNISRFAYRKARIQDVSLELNALSALPVVVTFVHAHVNVDDVLKNLHWDAAFSLSCCNPGGQLSRHHHIHEQGEDFGVLSCMRRYQVLLNRDSRRLDFSTREALVPPLAPLLKLSDSAH